MYGLLPTVPASSAASPDPIVSTHGVITPDIRGVLDCTPVIQLLVTRDGILEYANRAAGEYFGVSPDHLAGQRAGELLGCLYSIQTPENCGAGESCKNCGLRHGLWKILKEGADQARAELHTVVHRGGQKAEASVRVTVSQLHLNAHPFLLISLEDISSLRDVEDRLREQTTLLAETRDAICVTDVEGQIRFWNRGAEQLYGWSTEQAVAADIANVMFGGSRVSWAQLRHRVLEDGAWDGELQQFHRNSQSILVEMRASLMRGTGPDSRTILLVGSDVTDKRQLERQILKGQRLESLGTLACGIAHDLNNLLTPVQMVADLLQGSVTGTEGARFLELLSRSARRGSEVVKQLLAFGRGTEGSRTKIDLRALLKETGSILSETFPKSIRVQIDLPPALWPAVGDPTQIHQVVLNLCLNARDAMPRGGTLTLAAQNFTVDREGHPAVPEAAPGRYIVIQVTDTGVGISPELHERIFEPFFTTKPQGHGRGLGLSTAMTIVRTHKGYVRLMSQPGSGSQFSVYLPAQSDSPHEETLANHVPARPAQRHCILVAEDEEAIRELMKATLERAGYQVLTAGDGAEAISIFGRQASEISAVIIDMMMPFIDGPAAISMLRRLSPSIPILAVSGLPSQREEAERASGRRVLFLQKPFQMKELLNQINRCLQSSPDQPQPE